MNRMARARLSGPWEPEILLPSQMGGSSGHARCAELDLVAAILEDAVQCVRRHAAAQHGRERRQFDEAFNWLWDDTHEWPFAFVNVCSVLGLDPAAIREQLRQFIGKRGESDAASGAQPFDRSTDTPGRNRSASRQDSWDPAAERERLDIVGWDEA